MLWKPVPILIEDLIIVLEIWTFKWRMANMQYILFLISNKTWIYYFIRLFSILGRMLLGIWLIIIILCLNFLESFYTTLMSESCLNYLFTLRLFYFCRTNSQSNLCCYTNDPIALTDTGCFRNLLFPDAA